MTSDEIADRYRAAGYWGSAPLHEFVLRAARDTPDRVAVVGGERRLTHGELAATVETVAAGLWQESLRPGDRVVVQLPNVLELITTVLALIRIGATPVLTLPALGERELRHIVGATDAVGLVLDGGHRRNQAGFARRLRDEQESLRQIFLLSGAGPGDVDLAGLSARSGAIPAPAIAHAADADAIYLLSGGTTGLPKPIARTHQDYVYNLQLGIQLAGVSAASVYLAALPATHNFAFGCPGVLGTLAQGGRVVLTTNPTARRVFGLIASEQVTITAAVPSLAVQWGAAAAEAGDLESLHVLQVGGARLTREHAVQLLEVFRCRLQQVYGMAEGLLNFTRLDDPEQVVVETQGRPASPGDEWRLVDADEVDVTASGVGELQVRGPYTIRRYLADDATNRQAFTADGFYRTGDVVRLHPSGNFVVEGRNRDFVNRGGEKISAQELEELLATDERIAVAAVVAMPDRLLGERVCAYVVPRPGAQHPDLGSIRAALQAHGVARFKLPEHLELVDRLPLSAVGKVDRGALREDITRKTAEQGGPHGCAH